MSISASVLLLKLNEIVNIRDIYYIADTQYLELYFVADM